MRLRTVLFNTHLCLGLAAAVFVTILGVTGSIMAFEPEIEHVTHPHRWYVSPPPGARALSLRELSERVQRAYPGDTVQGYYVSTQPGLSYQIYLTQRVVYLDQYSGAVLDVDGGGPDWLNVVHQMHLRLLIQSRGDPGKKTVTAAAAVLLLMSLSGLYLWWPLKRVRISWDGGNRRSWFDLHNASGVLAFAFLLILTGTGLVMGFERSSTALFYRATGSQPSPRPDLHVTPVPGVTPIGADSAFAIARAALPGAAPFAMNLPPPGQAIVVRARFPEDRTPGGRSIVVLDPYTGRVRFAEGSRTAPAGARWVIANRALHTGDIFGLPSKFVMSLASLGAVLQVISGVMMWLKRKERGLRT